MERWCWNPLQTFTPVRSSHHIENKCFYDNNFKSFHSVLALQTYTLNEHSSALISATTQVYLSLGKLIKLCDEVLLSDNEESCASLSNENVTEVVELVDNAVEVSAWLMSMLECIIILRF